MNHNTAVVAVGVGALLAGWLVGIATVANRYSDKCADSAETTRLQACVRAGGSWVAGNCVGPLPAPVEGK